MPDPLQMFPVPPRRGVTTGSARLVPARTYGQLYRLLALLLVLQVLDLLLQITEVLR